MTSVKKTPTLIPYLTVRDTRKSIDFYMRAFGFSWINAQETAPDDTIDHVEMSYKDMLIMFARENAFGSLTKAPATLKSLPSMTLYLYCDDVDALYAQAIAAGAISQMEPQDSYWGDRIFKVADLDGFEWMFAKTIAK